jgi:hypothetical protein
LVLPDVHRATRFIMPPTSDVAPRIDPNKLSPAARAAAHKTDATESQHGGLLDCVTESCKINCSPKVKKTIPTKMVREF